MSETKVDFIYEGRTISIFCTEKDKIKEAINKFCFKAKVTKDSIYCLYSGNQIDENKVVKNLFQSKNKEEKITILVYSYNKESQEKKESKVKSSQIICPKCGEIALVTFKNYKLFITCKNNHVQESIFLNDFEKSQIIDESEIICNECKTINKSISYNKEFFICLNCKKSLCPLCKSNHNNNHYIINYDQKNYICFEHGDNFSLYCKTCKKNLCVACENGHIEHETITLGKLSPNKNHLEYRLIELGNNINKFKNEIKNMIDLLNKVCENIEIFYNINKDINNSFDIRKKNYEILYNIKEINNNSIARDIDEIIKEKNVRNKFNKIFDIYNNMISKESNNNYNN